MMYREHALCAEEMPAVDLCESTTLKVVVEVAGVVLPVLAGMALLLYVAMGESLLIQIAAFSAYLKAGVHCLMC